MKSLKCLLAALCALACSTVSAKERSTFSGGGGYSDDPYLISTVADLKQLSADINSGMGSDYKKCYFKLTADLDFSNEPVVDGRNFIPIGYNAMQYGKDNFLYAHFDGDGHTIKGIKQYSTETVSNAFRPTLGIFGETNCCEIMNLTLADSYFEGAFLVAGIVGVSQGTDVTNCHVLSSVTLAAAADGTSYMGSIYAYASRSTGYGGNMMGCTSAATITTNGKKECKYIGGLIGQAGNAANEDCLSLVTMDVGDDAEGVGMVIGDDWEMGSSDNTTDCYYLEGSPFGGVYDSEKRGCRSVEVQTEDPGIEGDRIYESFPNAPGVTSYYFNPINWYGVAYDGKWYHAGGTDPFPLYEGDTGSYQHPYQIKTVDDLRKLAKAVDYDRDYYRQYFDLQCDLDFGGGTETNFKPIGGKDKPFSGYFQGNGHTIKGIVIKKSKKNLDAMYNGIFGYKGTGEIKNLTLADSYIAGYNFTGGITGYASEDIVNCHVLADVTIAAGLDGTENIGGIMGGTTSNYSVEVQGCTNAATITTNGKTGCKNVGGIAGSVSFVQHSFATGPVIVGEDTENVGAIAGFITAEDHNMGSLKYNFYTADCLVRGINGCETDKARLATNVATAYTLEIGGQVASFTGFSGAPGLTCYENGIDYDGKFYYNPQKAKGHFPRYEGDEGTEAKPFLVKTTDDMDCLQKDLSQYTTFEGYHFALTSDLVYDSKVEDQYGNVSHVDDYAPGGNRYTQFQGVFDGQGHTVSGIWLNMSYVSYFSTISSRTPHDYSGIFGAIGANGEVKNLSLADSHIQGQNYVGGIVGYIKEGGTVTNCHVGDDVTIANWSGTNYYDPFDASGEHGGIAGENRGTIAGCTVAGTVEVTKLCGGIAGYSCGTIRDCLTLGNMEYNVNNSSGWKQVGGIVGCNNNGVYSNNLYGGVCQQKGAVESKDCDGAAKATVISTQASAMGSQTTAYTPFAQVPAITAFENGILYQGDYYVAGDICDLLGTITAPTTVSTDGLEDSSMENDIVNDVYYNLSTEDGNSYDTASGTIVIGESTDMSLVEDATPGSDDVREHFAGLIMKVAAGIGTVTVSVKTLGGMQLAVKVGDGLPTLASMDEQGNITVHYDVTEESYIYIYATVAPGVSTAREQARRAPATGSVSIYSLTITPEGPAARAAQTLELAAGWNWIGTAQREAADITALKAGATRILSQTQELVKDDEYDWVGNLTQLQPGQAYKVQAANAYSPVLAEAPVYTYQADLQLQKGWNWLAYPYSKSGDIAAILSNMEDGDYITSLTGGFTDYVSGSWDGSLAALQPGQGYLYRSASAKTVRLDFTKTSAAARSAAAVPGGSAAEAGSVLSAARRYPNTMNIIATVALDGQPLYGDSWQLRAYAPDGELRGVSQLCGDRHYLTIHGEEAVALRLEVVNLNTGEAFPADQTLTFADGIMGSRQEPVVFHAATVTGIHPQTRTDAETQTVYDLQGRRLSGTSLPKGTYIVNGRKHVVK